MGGRLSGIFIAKYLKPRTMVTCSLVCCIGAALLLVIVGGYSKIGVYVGTCKYTLEFFMYYPKLTSDECPLKCFRNMA